MPPRSPSLSLLLLLASACGRFAGLSADEPSVADVYVNVRADGAAARVEIATYGVEGDWSYGAFAGARLDELRVQTLEGQPVATDPPVFTPDPEHGGAFLVSAPALDASVDRLRVAGRFVGLNASGEAEVIRDFDHEVKVER